MCSCTEDNYKEIKKVRAALNKERAAMDIKERHPNDYELLNPYFKTALQKPDFILEDKNRENTGLILKQITDKNIKFQMVLRLKTSTDKDGFKNSVISAWQISDTRWVNYLNNRKILYKSE